MALGWSWLEIILFLWEQGIWMLEVEAKKWADFWSSVNSAIAQSKEICF